MARIVNEQGAEEAWDTTNIGAAGVNYSGALVFRVDDS